MLEVFNRKKNSILISWIISYVLILVLPLIVNVFIYVKSINAVKSEIVTSHMNILDQLYSKSDNTVREIERIYSESVYNENVKRLLNTDSGNKEAVLNLCSALLGTPYQSISYSNEFDNFIYYKKPGVILTKTSKYTPELQFNILDEKSTMKCSEVMEILNNVTQKTAVQIADTFSVIAYPIYDTNSPIVLGVFVAYFSEAYIQSVKKALEAYKDTSFLILGGDTNILTVNEINFDTKKLFNLNDSYIYTDKNIVLSQKSDILDIKYALVCPKSTFYHELQFTKFMIFVQLLIAIICGTYIIYLSIKKNYTPVKELVSLIEPHSVHSSDINEYELIRNTFDKNIKEILSLEKEQKGMNTLLYDIYVKNILLGNTESDSEYLEFITKYDIKLHSDKYCVLIINIDDYEEMFTGDNEIDDISSVGHIVTYAIKNIVSELGNLHHSIITCELKDKIVCILNIKAGDPRDFAQEIKNNIKRHLSVDISVALSSVHSEYTMLPTCYLEAVTAMEYSLLSECENIIRYDDLPENPTEYSFTSEKEIELINSIKSGNYKESCEIINSLFDISSTHIKINKLMVFDVAGAVIKAIDVAKKIYCYEEDINFDNLLILNDIASCNTIEDTKNKLLSVIKAFCDIINQHKAGKNIKLKNDIIKYVDNNFQNSALGVSQIADVLGKNPAYISRYFKQQMGIGLSDYINTKRVECAKVLLKKNININDIASMSGFVNAPSFIRVFKKQTGITPGAYREGL